MDYQPAEEREARKGGRSARSRTGGGAAQGGEEEDAEEGAVGRRQHHHQGRLVSVQNYTSLHSRPKTLWFVKRTVLCRHISTVVSTEARGV